MKPFPSYTIYLSICVFSLLFCIHSLFLWIGKNKIHQNILISHCITNENARHDKTSTHTHFKMRKLSSFAWILCLTYVHISNICVNGWHVRSMQFSVILILSHDDKWIMKRLYHNFPKFSNSFPNSKSVCTIRLVTKWSKIKVF